MDEKSLLLNGCRVCGVNCSEVSHHYRVKRSFRAYFRRITYQEGLQKMRRQCLGEEKSEK